MRWVIDQWDNKGQTVWPIFETTLTKDKKQWVQTKHIITFITRSYATYTLGISPISTYPLQVLRLADAGFGENSKFRMETQI